MQYQQAITNSRNTKMLKLKEVIAKCQLSRSTIYAKLDVKSERFDPEFPVPRKLGSQSVAWLEDEINEWILTRPGTRTLT
ncbi:helix-turn-helix transcriptional regulator [Acinetobacter seifertii]|uniref:helix-turn-helix transcriptional regulator n=1 Tax=Acinetobacter seifertii TaxID=1530123 RepID=UPI001580AE18|nr:AlpA family phage regulatory protein [Acinetobacter seifertii]NUF83082.1 AlpA family phage regulatory protein [Acinetobacter seifertii]